MVKKCTNVQNDSEIHHEFSKNHITRWTCLSRSNACDGEEILYAYLQHCRIRRDFFELERQQKDLNIREGILKAPQNGKKVYEWSKWLRNPSRVFQKWLSFKLANNYTVLTRRRKVANQSDIRSPTITLMSTILRLTQEPQTHPSSDAKSCKGEFVDCHTEVRMPGKLPTQRMLARTIKSWTQQARFRHQMQTFEWLQNRPSDNTYRGTITN